MCVPNLTAHSGRPVSIKQFLVVAPVIGNKSDDCRRQLGENRRRRRLEFYQTESWRIGGVQSGNQPGQPYIQQSSKDSNKQCERGRRTRHHVPCFGWVLLNERGKKEEKKKKLFFFSFILPLERRVLLAACPVPILSVVVCRFLPNGVPPVGRITRSAKLITLLFLNLLLLLPYVHV